MKEMIKVSHIFALFIMLLSCASAQRTLPEKYNLDNYLEPVRRISMHKVTDCENIDNQSVVLEADRNDFYLLVLREPIDIEYYNLYMDISNKVSKDEEISTQRRVGSKTTGRQGVNTEFVQGPSKIVSIVSGHDRVIAERDSGDNQYYVIEKMYKLKGREQAEEIKERLRKN